MPVLLTALIAFPVTARDRCLVFLQNVATCRRQYMLPLMMCGKIILTLIRMRRRHGRAAGQAGPQGGGAGAGTVPEPAPRAGDRSGVPGQRLLRRPGRGAGQVRDGAQGQGRRRPVTEAAAAFGYSRPAYYAAAAALESSGLDGLVPARPGPRGASKLTEEILAWAEEQLAADPALRPARLPDRIEEASGVRVHPRAVERALARRREHPK